MKWLKDKIQHYLDHRAKKKEFTRQWKIWVDRRLEEVKNEVWAEWYSKKDTAKQDYEKARDKWFKSNNGDEAEAEAEANFQKASDFYFYISPLIGSPYRQEELAQRLFGAALRIVEAEAEVLRAEIKRAEIESKRHIHGDDWANSKLYAENPAFCSEQYRDFVESVQRKQVMKQGKTEEIVALILAIIFFPITIFLIFGSLRWVK